MTRPLRTGRVLALAAVLLAAGAIRLGVTDQWIAAAALAYGTLLAALGACLERRAHRRILAQHERARRRARGEAPIAPLDPCCSFWLASDGAAHGRGCARPRADLSLAEQRSLALDYLETLTSRDINMTTRMHLLRMLDDGRSSGPTCAKTQGLDGTTYPPCARPAGHREAYCRDADRTRYFIAATPTRSHQ
ncbi:hypothetical protein AB0D33_01430 [Streptomyces sp. NPDC048404]|uniref:hypothetical protein n=1 Tax=unclassified Streptomyces TaxID=2593676 RepID=UPI003434F126